MIINVVNKTKLKTFFYLNNFKSIIDSVNSLFPNNSEMTLVITNNSEIQKLNKEFRNIDKPTNVLSFELEDDCYLGDVVISIDKIISEAKQQNKTILDHFTHLLIHGILHLHRFDHIKEQDAKKMEKKEVELLKKLQIENPYL